MIRKRRLGNTHLFVSELGFGGSSIGNLYTPCSHLASQEVMATCWNLGIRYFDTAPEYGHGLSERRMGDALRDHLREDYILSTKIGDVLYAHHTKLPPDNKFINKLPFHLKYDYSYDGIMRAFDDSLHRLGLNRIDILLVHDLDPIIHEEKSYSEHFKTYVESGYKALDQLKKDGIIQAIGLGVKKWEVCLDAMKYGNYECFMLQGNYTLLDQEAMNGFMDICLQKQISILLAGPYASGILATGPVKGAYYNHREANEEILQRVKRIQEICHTYHTPLPAAAIQFPLKHPAVASVVVSAASQEFMRKNIEFLQFEIPQELWDALKSAEFIREY